MMLKLTDRQWERIRDHFPEEHIGLGHPDRHPIPDEVKLVQPCFDFYMIKAAKRWWLVERFFGWLQWSRRLTVRWEYHPAGFLGFLHLDCIGISLKRI